MHFLWPGLLPLLLFVPILLGAYIWSQRRRARFALRYSSLSLVKEAIVKQSRYRRHIPPLLFLLAITAMLVAAARPFAVSFVPKNQATVILTIDVSGSMRAADIKPTRIEAAKEAAIEFANRQGPNTRIGVVAFSGSAQVIQSPTTDHNAVIAAIQQLYPQRSTAIGSGILVSLDAIFGDTHLDASTAPVAAAATPGPTPSAVPPGTHVPAIIVLLTDGQNVIGPPPLEAAQAAADRGVRVFTIGVGTQQGAVIGGGGGSFGGGGRGGGFGFRAELDEPTLQQIAQITDGQYFRATDENGLTEIYRNLNTQFIVSREQTELTYQFAGVAIAFVLAGSVLGLLWFGRIP